MVAVMLTKIFLAVALVLSILQRTYGLRNHDCHEPCHAGFCRFQGCHDEPAECDGGLCEFHDCTNPNCSGK